MGGLFHFSDVLRGPGNAEQHATEKERCTKGNGQSRFAIILVSHIASR
jgi:hypothetical protein